MKLARIGQMGQEIPVAQAGDGTWRDISTVVNDLDGGVLNGALAHVQAALDAGDLPVVEAGRFGPPLGRIGKIVCIGLNYRDHAAETGAALPAEPVVFMKAPDTVVGPNDEVLVPRGSKRTDWEVELAVVIGSPARYLESHEAAAAFIAGYAISHDVSERDYQLERVMPLLTADRMAAEFPVEVGGHRYVTARWLTHLASHLGYHLGQVDYHRRMVAPASGTVGTMSLTEL